MEPNILSREKIVSLINGVSKLFICKRMKLDLYLIPLIPFLLCTELMCPKEANFLFDLGIIFSKNIHKLFLADTMV